MFFQSNLVSNYEQISLTVDDNQLCIPKYKEYPFIVIDKDGEVYSYEAYPLIYSKKYHQPQPGTEWTYLGQIFLENDKPYQPSDVLVSKVF